MNDNLEQGGSLMDVLDTGVRQYYRENEMFKNFVDNVKPELSIRHLYLF